VSRTQSATLSLKPGLKELKTYCDDIWPCFLVGKQFRRRVGGLRMVGDGDASLRKQT